MRADCGFIRDPREHVVQLGPRDPQLSRLFARLLEQFLNLTQAPFAKELVVPRGYEAALSLHGCDKSFGLQVGVRALGGYYADAEAVRERADGGKFLPAWKRARQNLGFHLRGYLLVDGLVARVG